MTTAPTDQIRQRIHEFEFKELFIEELGWDHYPRPPLQIDVEGESFELIPVSEKRGLGVFLCYSTSNQEAPDYATRLKIDRHVRKDVYEHLVIYVDPGKTVQIWQWVKRGAGGRATRPRERQYRKGQTGEHVLEAVRQLSIHLSQEEGLTISDVTGQMSEAFDVEKVTKRFYDKFKEEHTDFLKFIKGITESSDRDWYASLMLNRLMFVYFIQKKGLLDGDLDYMRGRLRTLRAEHGKDKFYSFYRYFLLRLFHEGLGQRPEERAADLDGLLGSIPYLNGGLFEVHQLEGLYDAIEIPDIAFARILDFFEQYQWRLDDRPVKTDNEINPDVLGHIFEKFVNQKQMGAYYSKGDITDYISRTAIVPRILELTEQQCSIAFRPEGSVWKLLREDPDRYIFQSIKWGMDEALPESIAVGTNDPSKRIGWNTAAPATHALATETWREHIERRARCKDLRTRLKDGEFTESTNLVAETLNLRQFVEDAILFSEGPELVRAFFHVIRQVRILDPTCGSGAFLFAALNILEGIYEACLERMAVFVFESDQKGDDQAFEDFRRILAEVEAHPNRAYYILKSIVVSNLFGVDIMEEAVEICKLRLFLKLVAQVDNTADLEPLPDIDFNIRPGNALVGFANEASLEAALGARLDIGEVKDGLLVLAEEAATAFRHFQHLQVDPGGTADDIRALKESLRSKFAQLSSVLDKYLAAQYGADKPSTYTKWRASHQPFHWLVDFYEVLARGGFDAIIGNPPYVEYKNVKSTYTVQDFATLECGDLYALSMERSLELLSNGGRFGMIIPVSITGTDGFGPLRKLLLDAASETFILNFAERPSKLFTGVEKRLSIWQLRKGAAETRRVWTSNYRRWFAEEREILFDTSVLVEITGLGSLVNTALPKIRSTIERGVIEKLRNEAKPLGLSFLKSSKHEVFYTRKVRYFVQFFLNVPIIRNSKGQILEPSELKTLHFHDRKQQHAAVAALNSNLFFWMFSAYSDVRNLNRREIELFPINLPALAQDHEDDLAELVRELMKDFKKNSVMTTSKYGHGTLTIQSFRPRLAKPIIDSIDEVLASYYGLEPDEAEFIINFDVKYRLGLKSGEEPDE